MDDGTGKRMLDELKRLWNMRMDSLKFQKQDMFKRVKPNPTEWLDVIIDGEMYEINGKGETRKKNTYFINGGGKDNAQLPSVPNSEGHTQSETEKGQA